MFSKKVKITINNPCQEDWSKMIPLDGGSYCGSCSKVVIDFSSKTIDEISLFLKNNPAGQCGRFKAEQLNQVYSIPYGIKVSKRTLRYAFAALLGFRAFEGYAQNDTNFFDLRIQRDSVSQNDSLRANSLVANQDSVMLDTLPNVFVDRDQEGNIISERTVLKPNLEYVQVMTGNVLVSEMFISGGIGMVSNQINIEPNYYCVVESSVRKIIYLPIFPKMNEEGEFDSYMCVVRKEEQEKRLDKFVFNLKNQYPTPNKSGKPTKKLDAIINLNIRLRSRRFKIKS